MLYNEVVTNLLKKGFCFLFPIIFIQTRIFFMQGYSQAVGKAVEKIRADYSIV